MKIRKVGSGGLQPEIRCGGKAAVQQMHQDFLGGFKRAIIAAGGFHEQLLGEHGLHHAKCFLRHRAQAAARVHADQIAQPHAGTDQQREPPLMIAVFDLNIIRFALGEQRAFADERARFIGDLPHPHGAVEQRIGKTLRTIMRRDAKRIVQHQQGAVQQPARIARQQAHIILREEIRKQRICAGKDQRFHFNTPLFIVLSAQWIPSKLYPESIAGARKKSKIVYAIGKEMKAEAPRTDCANGFRPGAARDERTGDGEHESCIHHKRKSPPEFLSGFQMALT